MTDYAEQIRQEQEAALAAIRREFDKIATILGYDDEECDSCPNQV